mmetsp:Transcript_3157/g.11791  ORF Transcript_3157/g.11791 Transcript_3157/m.11791 type:complete len:276 (-) Transcript_3157:31-858(-)
MASATPPTPVAAPVTADTAPGAARRVDDGEALQRRRRQRGFSPRRRERRDRRDRRRRFEPARVHLPARDASRLATPLLERSLGGRELGAGFLGGVCGGGDPRASSLRQSRPSLLLFPFASSLHRRVARLLPPHSRRLVLGDGPFRLIRGVVALLRALRPRALRPDPAKLRLGGGDALDPAPRSRRRYARDDSRAPGGPVVGGSDPRGGQSGARSFHRGRVRHASGGVRESPRAAVPNRKPRDPIRKSHPKVTRDLSDSTADSIRPARRRDPLHRL